MPFHTDPAHDTRKADSIKEEIAAQLGATAAELTALKPTCELRWVERRMMGDATTLVCVRVLQQRWVRALTDQSEWRDVPVVRECEL